MVEVFSGGGGGGLRSEVMADLVADFAYSFAGDA